MVGIEPTTLQFQAEVAALDSHLEILFYNIRNILNNVNTFVNYFFRADGGVRAHYLSHTKGIFTPMNFISDFDCSPGRTRTYNSFHTWLTVRPDANYGLLRNLIYGLSTYLPCFFLFNFLSCRLLNFLYPITLLQLLRVNIKI